MKVRRSLHTFSLYHDDKEKHEGDTRDLETTRNPLRLCERLFFIPIL
jgi:hypothetical protein